MKLVDYGVGVLEDCGVEFYVGKLVKEVIVDGVKYVESENEVCEIKVVIIIWVVGVCGNSVIEVFGFEVGCGCVKVNNNLIVFGNEEILIVGDCLLIINLVNDCLFLLIV